MGFCRKPSRTPKAQNSSPKRTAAPYIRSPMQIAAESRNRPLRPLLPRGCARAAHRAPPVSRFGRTTCSSPCLAPRGGALLCARCPRCPVTYSLLPYLPRTSVATLPGGQPPASAGSMAVPSAMPGDGAPQHHRTHGAITVRCGSVLPQGAARGVCMCSHFHHHHLASSRRRKQHSPSSERHGERWGRSHAPPAAGGSSSSRTIEAMSASHASPPSSSLR